MISKYIVTESSHRDFKCLCADLDEDMDITVDSEFEVDATFSLGAQQMSSGNQ